MEFSKAAHKAFLSLLFYIVTPSGLQQKQFSIGKLLIAASTAKKLLEGTNEADGKTHFKDGGVTFTAEEWVFLKELFNQKTDGTIADVVNIEEIKEIFNKE